MSTAERRRKEIRTSLLATLITIAMLVVGFVVARPWMHAASEARLRAMLVAEPFSRVKAGASFVRVSDLDLLEILSRDDDCVSNLTNINFSSVVFRPQDSVYLSQLENVSSIGFYCCHNADNVLPACRSLPLKSAFFELTPLDAESIGAIGSIPTLTEIQLEQGITPEQIEVLKSLPSTVKVQTSYPHMLE